MRGLCFFFHHETMVSHRIVGHDRDPSWKTGHQVAFSVTELGKPKKNGQNAGLTEGTHRSVVTFG